MIRLLLDAGADPSTPRNCRYNEWTSPLGIAIDNEQPWLVEMLLAGEAGLDPYNATQLNGVLAAGEVGASVMEALDGEANLDKADTGSSGPEDDSDSGPNCQMEADSHQGPANR